MSRLLETSPRTAVGPTGAGPGGYAASTVVVTPEGWTTLSELLPDDTVFDRCGRMVVVDEVYTIADQQHLVELTFAHGARVVCSPAQSFSFAVVGSARAASAVVSTAQWVSTQRLAVAELRRMRLDLSVGYEATLTELLRQLRARGVMLWRDVAEFGAVVVPGVAPIEGSADDLATSLWTAHAVLRYLDELLRREPAAPGEWLFRAEEVGRFRRGAGLGICTGMALEIPGGSSVDVLRAPTHVRTEALAALVRQEGQVDGRLLVRDGEGVRFAVELLASLGIAYRVVRESADVIRVSYSTRRRSVPVSVAAVHQHAPGPVLGLRLADGSRSFLGPGFTALLT